VCELHCRVEGLELYRSALRVVDGTGCDAMTNDICADGVCQVRYRCRFGSSSSSSSADNNNNKNKLVLRPSFQDNSDELVYQSLTGISITFVML